MVETLMSVYTDILQRAIDRRRETVGPPMVNEAVKELLDCRSRLAVTQPIERPTDWVAPLGPRGEKGGPRGEKGSEHALGLSMGLLIEGAPPFAARSVNVVGKNLGFQCRTIR